ncbi:DUF1127 domain-containing protein [Microvirga terricola]|uniref:DUF1127 domain-containing protein n=1 Tax=Microvirga terricola TaxID=2719797 RepID=A0ABX0VD17_9HYPH|nr:DUF1127 domain-containing protein [Microvirga terricola]NIX75732.1 DUF1127 domain-containing protein [Microvirga terricola]
MAAALCVENLLPHPARTTRGTAWLELLMKVEAWLDDRASRRALYRLDEAALADLALSQADVERINKTAGDAS